VNKKDGDKFALVFDYKSLQFELLGKITAEAIQARPLNSDVIKDYMQHSPEIVNALGGWNSVNLLRIKNEIEAYLASTFPVYAFEPIKIVWSNGNDRFTIS